MLRDPEYQGLQSLRPVVVIYDYLVRRIRIVRFGGPQMPQPSDSLQSDQRRITGPRCSRLMTNIVARELQVRDGLHRDSYSTIRLGWGYAYFGSSFSEVPH